MGSSVRENKHLPLSQPVTLMSPDQTQLLESRQQPRIGKCSRRCSRSLTSAPCTKCSRLESATPKQDKCIQMTPLDYSLLMEEIQTSGTASSPKSIPTMPFPGQKSLEGTSSCASTSHSKDYDGTVQTSSSTMDTSLQECGFYWCTHRGSQRICHAV